MGSAPPETLQLDAQRVHVWRVDLDVEAPSLVQALATLSEDERARGDSFYFDRDRTSYIAARGALRGILGRYLGLPRESLRFSYGPHGKPDVAHPPATSLRFNLAHAQGLAVIAVARGRDVGIDIERPRAALDYESLARRFFAPREVEALLALSPEARQQAFVRCWTRKEAFVKARGLGLLLNLDRFEVSVAPEEPAAVLAVHDDPQEASRWSLRDLEPGGDSVASLAAQGQDWFVEMWDWPWRP